MSGRLRRSPKNSTPQLQLFCLLQSTGAQTIESQEQVQHENAKSKQYRDQQLAYCTQREQQRDSVSAQLMRASQ